MSTASPISEQSNDVEKELSEEDVLEYPITVGVEAR